MPSSVGVSRRTHRVPRNSSSVRADIIRIQLVPAHEFVRRAMEVVVARLGRDVNDAAAGPSILSVIEVRHHAKLLNRVHSRNERNVVHGVGAVGGRIRDRVVGLAVEEKIVGLLKTAIDGEVDVVAVIEWPLKLLVAVENNAVREIREIDRIAPDYPQLRHPGVVHDLAAVRRGFVHKRWSGSHRDALRHRAQLELKIRRYRFAHSDFNILSGRRLETRSLNSHRVAARNQERNRVVTLLCCGGRRLFVSGLIFRSDTGVRNCVLRWVGNQPVYGASELLGISRTSKRWRATGLA